MRSILACGLALGLILCVGMRSGAEEKRAKDTGDGQIAHMVYFTLKDNSPEAKKKLVEACNKYLSKHEGTLYFSAGVRGEDFSREVNDRDFDVALHLVFKDKAAHNKYQDHERHKKFIEENKENWKKVRVFDAVVSK